MVRQTGTWQTFMKPPPQTWNRQSGDKVVRMQSSEANTSPRITLTLVCLLCLLLISVFSHRIRSEETPEVVRYTDITESSKIHFQARNSATPNKYLIETMIGGVGLLDYDNDGWLDIFFVNGAKLKDPQPDGEELDKSSPEFWNHLYRNNHDGTFTDVTEKAGLKGKGYGNGVAVGDFNNDGYPDLLVTNYGPCILYRNNGNGTFTETGTLAGVGYTDQGNTFSGMGTDAQDLDDDGFFDIITTALSNETFAYFHNNGDGTFTFATMMSNLGDITRLFGGWGMHIYDYDNDGFKDLFLANSHVMDNIEKEQPHLSYMQKPLLLRNNGKHFVDVSAVSGEVFTRMYASRGAAFGDIDNDGDIDVVVSNLTSPAYILRNDGGNKNTWIGLDLRGTKSNRDGIGAKIKLTSESGKVQYCQVTSESSYQSANDRRVFIGIGKEKKIKEIRIAWPSGIQQVLTNPEPRQILKVEEKADKTS
jgi:hypothetical protein